jgi:predicted aconitase with swiveling domain
LSVVRGRAIVRGRAEGSVLLSTRSISLWGGVDSVSGRIIDRQHDRLGESVVGRVFAFPAEKGSSTGSAVLLELIRADRAPAAIVTQHLAPIVALGAIVAEELYGRTIPILVISEAGFGGLCDGEWVSIAEGGEIRGPER